MHPYQQIGSRAFWATGVAQKAPGDVSELWTPKHAIGQHDAVATFGSCFAQHFGKALGQRGFNWLIAEPAPMALSAESRRKFGYDVFSARTGNIYTASMLKQWVSWALNDSAMPDEVWTSDGRSYDPFRPTLEPNGFASIDEVRASQACSREAFGRALVEADVLVFTLGLTETWNNAAQGYEYPVCPGTAAGVFDPQAHRFVNQDYGFIHDALSDVVTRIRSINADLRVLLTVSPVPLTATMSGNHVLVATMESKSILRAVAGAVARRFEHVDYFPSYEIISAPAFKGAFFEPNRRTVTAAGVERVMDCFFGSLAPTTGIDRVATERRQPEAMQDDDDSICEDLLLEAFAPKA